MSEAMPSEGVTVTFRMPPELDRKIEEQLDYGDYKSEWIRDAIRQKLEDTNKETEKSNE